MKMPQFVRKAFWVNSILILVMGICGVAGAQDQQTVKQLQQLIEQQQQQLEAQQKALEAQNKALRDLKNRVETLTTEEAVVEAKAAEAERLAEEAVRKAQQAKAEADRAHREAIAVDIEKEEDLHRTQGKTFHIPETKTVLTLSGYAKADVIHDFDKIESPYKFAARRIAVNGDSSDEPSSRTTVTANASRFVIASATPTDYGKLSTLISMDFAGNTTSSDPDPRFRQGWGQLDDLFWGGGLRAGQAWSSWNDVPALPETMDFEGPNGSQQTRQGLVRWFRDFQKKYTLWVSIENPNYSIQNGKEKSAWPDTIASLNWHGDWGHLKPAVIGRQLQGDNDDGGDDDTTFGWGAQLSGDIKVPLLAQKDNFKFQAVYGAGIGSYNNDGGIDDAVFDGNDLKAIKSFQGYGAFQHWWTDSLRSNAVFGYVDVDTRNQQPSDTLERTMYFAGNLVWSPIDHMDIGMEYLWGQRDNKNSDVGTARRVQFSTKYLF
jgi:Tfp pilus assembly protein PilV